MLHDIVDLQFPGLFEAYATQLTSAGYRGWRQPRPQNPRVTHGPPTPHPQIFLSTAAGFRLVTKNVCGAAEKIPGLFVSLRAFSLCFFSAI